jgi:hypothetical protein
MCIVTESNNPRRRHRPAYLAPTRLGVPAALIADVENNGAATAPALQETIDIHMVPTTHDYQGEQNTEKSYYSLPAMLSSIYRSLVDLLLLIVVMIMSFFLYDVEITIVRSEHAPVMRHGDITGSRVVWRNEIDPVPEPRLWRTTRRGFDTDSAV